MSKNELTAESLERAIKEISKRTKPVDILSPVQVVIPENLLKEFDKEKGGQQ